MVKTTDLFLAEFADRFGNTEQEKDAIRSSTGFYMDYLDGVFCLYKQVLRDRIYTYSGGDNDGNLLDCEDYRFFWSGLLDIQEEFKDWLNRHGFTDEDMMTLTGEFYGDEGMNVSCAFSFYSERFK